MKKRDAIGNIRAQIYVWKKHEKIANKARNYIYAEHCKCKAEALGNAIIVINSIDKL